METKGRVSVIGAGEMGHGIAQLAAMAEYEVVLIDLTAELALNGKKKIKENLEEHFVAKEKISQAESENILNRILTYGSSNGYTHAADSLFVIEAVKENLDIKSELFRELDKQCADSTILASNTSSIVISLIAASTRRPERVIGLHFMNPPQRMKVVEVIRGNETSDETYEKTMKFAVELGKEPYVVRDRYGFIVNRMMVAGINQAVALREEGHPAESIDGLMEKTNYNEGPLKLADRIGLDVCLNIMKIIYRNTRKPEYAPHPLLLKMVADGHLGRKSGKGFYEYSRTKQS